MYIIIHEDGSKINGKVYLSAHRTNTSHSIFRTMMNRNVISVNHL